LAAVFVDAGAKLAFTFVCKSFLWAI